MSFSFATIRGKVRGGLQFALLVVGVAACSFSGGGGSDIPNSVNGFVVSSAGEPLEGVAIHLRSKSWTPGSPGSEWTTRSDADGGYTLPPFAIGEELVLEYEDSAHSEGAIRPLDRASIESGRIPTVKLDGWGRLAGTCVSDSVVVIATDRLYIPELGREIRPDSTGAWEFADVPPGDYSPVLVSRSMDGLFQFPVAGVKQRSKTVIAPILLADSSAGTWRGVVFDADGNPAAGVRTTWTNLADSSSRGMLAASDDSGRVVVPLPSNGRWSYRWISPSGESRAQVVEYPDTTSDHHLTLPVEVRLRR